VFPGPSVEAPLNSNYFYEALVNVTGLGMHAVLLSLTLSARQHVLCYRVTESCVLYVTPLRVIFLINADLASRRLSSYDVNL